MIKEGNTEAAKSLIERGVGVTLADKDNGVTPLHWAVYHGNTVVAAMLLAKGAEADKPKENGVTPLGYVIWRAIRAATDRDTKPYHLYADPVTHQGTKDIVKAVIKEREAIIMLLVAHGADPTTSCGSMGSDKYFTLLKLMHLSGYEGGVKAYLEYKS